MPMHAPKQQQGHAFEQQARAYLEAKGLSYLAHNWQQAGVGEIDLIMLERGTAWDIVVFIEVRQRRVSHFGDAIESVTRKKQQNIVKTAKHFLQQHPQYADCECRFDVLGYSGTDAQGAASAPTWIQGAFMAQAW
ncbi:YraN family protein [Psychrobacter aestuarii]|uniref:UPF0102 protein GCM10009129_12160 n=2 Tax=Psychrobacter aestuarii TaxID=556327 RepID=A0ABN0VTJ4_9GAMM